MIPVTRTYLPPIDEYITQVQRAYNNGWITNRGELVLELENKLKDYLKVPYLTATTNGTLPIQIAIKALNLEGEIITTPFSYVATTASIVWENCKPVFVDVDPDYLTIDETKIEQAITPSTTAILATHVFGNPCNVIAIDTIAKKYNLKVIYDAAHCFGVKYLGESILNYGNVSACSFHATKLFHTGEGGCWVTKDEELQRNLFYHHNFGHSSQIDFHGLGINAKMSELQAAMGLAVLPHMETIINARKQVVDYYDNFLDFSNLQKIKIREATDWNYSYYPILFESEEALIATQKKLNANDIFPRRYFYPSLNRLPYLLYEPIPISENVAARVMCLPLYVDLRQDEISKIIDIISDANN